MEISGEASAATMFDWLWSWAVITKVSCSILSLNQSLFQIPARKRSSANKMSGTLFTRPSYSFKISDGEAS